VGVVIRSGTATDVDAAVAVFERSNLARREGVWPNQAERVERVRGHLLSPATWFLVADDGAARVAMASVCPLRSDGGAGPEIPGACLLAYLYVVPERWGEGIGGAVSDVVLAEVQRRGYARVHLWTHHDNERSHRLYRSHGFAPTGRTTSEEGEWARAIEGVAS